MDTELELALAWAIAGLVMLFTNLRCGDPTIKNMFFALMLIAFVVAGYFLVQFTRAHS